MLVRGVSEASIQALCEAHGFSQVLDRAAFFCDYERIGSKPDLLDVRVVFVGESKTSHLYVVAN